MGRPPKYSEAEKMQEQIDNYFLYVAENEDIPVVEELALYLGFVDRQSLLDYQKKEEFSGIIKRAKTKIFTIQKKLAMRNKMNATVWIFNAKNNYGYSDKHEVEHQGEIQIDHVVLIPQAKTIDEWKQEHSMGTAAEAG